MNAPFRVLHVDNDAGIRTIFELALHLDPSIDLVSASSGDEALDHLDHDDWMPHIALLDAVMPSMSGLELLNELHARHQTAHLPVLFVTATTRSAEVQHYLDAGAIGVISKPFEAVGLAKRVRAHFEGWKRRHAL
jgi:DNA-binding response OmpR family regulator